MFGFTKTAKKALWDAIQVLNNRVMELEKKDKLTDFYADSCQTLAVDLKTGTTFTDSGVYSPETMNTFTTKKKPSKRKRTSKK